MRTLPVAAEEAIRDNLEGTQAVAGLSIDRRAR
jgi:hypothetical protein